MFDSLKELLYELLSSAFVNFDVMVGKSADTLSGNLTQWDYVINTFANALKPACNTILALCLMIEIVQMLQKSDIMKWEYALKGGVKIVLARVCLDSAPIVLKACYLQTQQWIYDIDSSTPWQTTLSVDELYTPIMDIDGLGAILGMFITCFILALAIKICGLIIQVIAIGRVFEIYVYLAVSPFPLAFLPLGTGTDGIASRITLKFLKNFIAVCMQGVMMMIVLRIFGTVANGLINSIAGSVTDGGISGTADITDFIFVMLLSCIALVMSVLKSGSWAKSIIDAM